MKRWPGSLLCALSVLALLAGLLGNGRAGWAAGSRAAKPGATATPTGVACPKRVKPRGTILFSDWEFPDTLNIYQTQLAVSSEITLGLIHPLFQYDNRLRLQPVLATQIPTIQNRGITGGGKIITIHLRRGMRWSNGAEITSQDVKFGWQVDSDAATGPYCLTGCNVISSIDTPDPYTAVLHLKRVDAAAIPLAMPDVWPHAWGTDWNGSSHAAALKLGQDQRFNFEDPTFPTDGPYQVTQFVTDDRIVLNPMPYYDVMTCGAHVKYLIFSYYSAKADMLAAAAQQGTDVTEDYSPADLPALLSYHNVFTTDVLPSFTLERLELMVDPRYRGVANPLANATVRQALALALDKTGLIESALGLNAAETGKIIAWTPWVQEPGVAQPYADRAIDGQWDPLAHRYLMPGTPPAVSDAQRLLAGTPYKRGFSLDVVTTAGNAVRQAQVAIVAASWHKIGVQVNPIYAPAATLFGNYRSGGILATGTFQVAMFRSTYLPDPDNLRTDLASGFIDRRARIHSEINTNYSGIRDPVIDRALTTGAGSFDGKVRAQAYATVQVEMNKMAYWIPLYFLPKIVTHDKHLQNFSPNPASGDEWNLYAWQATGNG